MGEEQEEDCPDCYESAGVIVSDEICQTLKKKSDIDCKELAQNVIDRKISPREYMDTLIDHAEDIGSNADAEILKEIKRLMYEKQD